MHNHTTTMNTNRMPRLGKKFLCRLSTLAGFAALGALTWPALNAAEEAASTTPKATSGTETALATPTASTPTTKTPEKPTATDSDTVRLPSVVVEAAYPSGSALRGYLEDDMKHVGPWGQLALQDTPYSVTVLSSELIQNSAYGNSNRLWDLTPNVYYGFGAGYYTSDDTGNPDARGFGMTGLINGIRMAGGAGGYSMQELERVEVNNGLTGFLYGGGYVGGSVNFVTKRPTKEQKTSVTAANEGGRSVLLHADIGGPVPGTDGILGYRINALAGDGEGPVHGVSTDRKLISGAIDLNLSKNFVWSFDASYRENNRQGQASRGFSTGPDGLMLPPLNPHYSYLPEWAFCDSISRRVGSSINWKINEIFSIRASYLWQKNDSTFISIDTDPLANYAGYYQGDYKLNYDNWLWGNTQHGGFIYGDAKFDTWKFHHTVTAGVNYNYQESRNPTNYSVGWNSDIGHANYYNIGSWNIPEPDRNLLPPRGAWHVRSRGQYLNFAIGDEIKYRDDFILMLGYVYSNIWTRSYNWGTGAISNPANPRASMYNEGKSSYTASLIYKPVKDLSIYATWIEAQEAGTYVGPGASPRYRNEDTYLPPTISDQFEIGAKYSLGGVLFAGSLFYIDKTNLYDDFHDDGTRTRVQDGRQIHKGIEVSATGNLFKRLTVMGGFTWLDVEIQKTNSTYSLLDPNTGIRTTYSQKGQMPNNIPHWIAKTYLEYRLPFVEGLFLTGGVQYMGTRYYTIPNNHKLPAYIIGDVGMRYNTRIKEMDVTFRFNVTNVTDEWYWRRVNSACLGEPRTFTFSTTVSF